MNAFVETVVEEEDALSENDKKKLRRLYVSIASI